MKMEIPVLAPRAGKLARFLVEEGEAVSEGQPIAEID
jgi:acetyl-CoA carboxylase biotin carboxyl carrier protein